MSLNLPWFRSGGFWHATEDEKTSLCGITPLNKPKLVRSEDELPPDPCRKCLFLALVDEVEEEPDWVTRERGFEVSGPLD